MPFYSRVISSVAAWRTVIVVALAVATFAVVLTLLGSAQTQITRTWDGGGADNNWSTAGNWSSDNAPDGTDEAALFTNDPVGQTKLTPVLSADVTIGQLQYSATAPSYTISGSGAPILYISPPASYGGVGLTVASGAANQTISPEVFFLSTQSWDIGGTTTLTASGTIEDDSVIDYGLTKNGTGTLVFPGDVRYDGPTTVNAGSLILSFSNTSMLSAFTINGGILRATSSANALGNNATRNTMTLAGGALELANNTGLTFGSTSRVTSVTGSATIRSDRLTAGAGVTHTLGTLNVGAQTLSVTAGANATSGTAGTTFGATTLSGNATLNVVNGAANAQLTLGAVGPASPARSLTKTGNGTLRLNGAGSYTGGTTLSQGALTLGVANALGSGGFNFAGGTLNANNVTDSTIGALALTANSTLNLSPGGAAATLTFTGASGTASGILTITGWSGTPGASGTNDKVVFSGGTTPSADFLQHIRFDLGGGNIYPGALGAGGELIPSAASSGTISFSGVEHLGTPTDTSIAINVVPDANATIYYEYGTASGVYTNQTAPIAALASEPCEIVLTGLQPNTRYFYRMRYEAAANPGTWTARSEYQFRTQRPAGSTYSFVLTSDSHVNLQLGTLSEWQTTLDMIAAERPDFMIDLGDTFAMDNGTTSVTSAAAADQVYLFQRSASILGRASPSVPMFFVMGNHEDEEGWNFNDVSPLPIWGLKARKRYFPAPSPLTAPTFYSANTDPIKPGDVTPPNSHIIGSDQYREDYYAWTWGDALFVVFDPFQYTMQNPYGAMAGEGSDDPAAGDRWNWTMGIQQHQWLNNVLSTSTAKYKFLFAHHMLGGTQNYVRGGAEPAHQFEWGGYNADGTTWGWDTQRPAAAGWIKPVRQMMIDYGVTAFFHGHDHQFAYELRDGMVYQEVPAASQGTTSGFGSYNSSPFLVNQSANSGYLRVTISPSQATVEYVKTTGTNVGQVQYSYTMAPSAGSSHVITASAGANGSITPSGAVNVADGANQSFVVTPNPGYAVAGVLVDGSSVGAVTNYQFSNVTVNHTITVSFAPQAVTVPNVFGLTQSAAATTFSSTGLVVGTITSAPHATVPIGSVIAQSPAAGSTVPAGTAVALTVSSGVTVPNVVGQTQSAATATLTTAGFLVTSSTQASASVPIGSVISQNPAGGAAASGGSTVALVISSGATSVGLVAAYNFDDGSGTVLTDVTTRGHNGTISGATWTSSGHSGSALSFGGSASVTVSDANDLDLTTGMTLEAWVYPTATPSGWQAIVDKNLDRYYLMASSAPNNRPAVGGTWAAGNTNLAAPTALSVNAWTHLATTYDGATVRLYVNGVQVASRVESTPLTTSTSTLQIGGDSYPDEYFAGRIDDLRIYNRALSAGEIQTDMNTPVAPPGVMVLVPNVTNVLQATAQSTLIAAGLTAGAITTANSNTVTAGYVISQNPAAGASVPNGSSVDLLVSLGAQTNVPPIVVLTSPADHATGLGTSAMLTASVTDTDATTVTFYGRKTAPAVAGPDFVIATLPDTQYYSQNTGGNLAATFFQQTQWYADSRSALNLAFLSHMGDMVQSGDNGSDNSEWNIADQAMRTIEDPARTGLPYGIPWGGAPGNHDQTTNGQVNAPNAKWNQFFGANRWAGRPYFGGSFSPTNNSNHYELFDASGLEFLIIHLDYTTAAGVNQAVIDWADGLMKAYPQRRAIVTSHWILDLPPTSPIGAPAPFGGPGQRFFDEFKDNPNFFLMLSGHQHGEGRRTDVFNGRTIYSVLQDYQERVNGGDGWLRYFVFSPANNTITAKTYSPKLGQFESDTDATSSPLNQASEFVLPYNMQTAVASWTVLGTVNVPGGGGSAQFNWTGLQAGSTYEWYVGASDGLATTTSTVRSFSTSANTSPSVALASPAANSVFTTPVDITLTATASDADGSITRVEFFDGTTKLGEDTTSPYSYLWTNAPAGGHVLSAVATDNTAATTASASVAITVNAPSNQAPIASGQSLVITEDAAATPITLAATDSDGDALTYSIVAGPAHGTLGGSAPAVTYRPAANYNGADSFTFRASDGQANSNTATVSITIQPVNDAPSATGESYTVQSGSTLTIAAPGVLANDSDIEGSALTAQLASPPSHGSLTLNANGSFNYTPAGGYTGPDAFSYAVSDGQAGSGVATAGITVTAAPVPTCSLSVSPTSITAGGAATLSWTTQNATSLSIDSGVGAVTPVAAGSQSVSPGSTTNYTGAVSGPGGTNGCATVLTVTTGSPGPSGLIAAYEFSAGTGTTIADSSGNNLTGTATSTTWTTAGKYGNALSFNGTSSYVNLANPSALQATGSMTWAAWVKATSTPADDGQIISKSSGSDGWQLKTSPDTGPHTFGVRVTGSTGVVQRYSATVRALNTWYHVAAVYNASARTLDIYVNGVLDNGVLLGTIPAAQTATTTNVNIGRRSGGFYFGGVLDDVRVYGRALTAGEIQTVMSTPIP